MPQKLKAHYTGFLNHVASTETPLQTCFKLFRFVYNSFVTQDKCRHYGICVYKLNSGRQIGLWKVKLHNFSFRMSVQAQADVFLKYYTYVFNNCIHSVHTSKESAMFSTEWPIIHTCNTKRKKISHNVQVSCRIWDALNEILFK